MQNKYRQFIAVLMIIGVQTVSSKRVCSRQQIKAELIYSQLISACLQQTGLKVVMDKPAEVCEGFDESKFLLDFSTLEFIQTDDDQFHISGSVTVKENIEAPVKVL